ncbi:segregation and condensation protein ScpB [Ligilactobacillus salitolerans]|uniref:Segregation and condensation protein B n=1 Tax=Ligilactobacillus salitolerans TaxID=1808352 RepID=A0A401ITJ9_9LACO|nr:segregation and condensation protein ScpB [Ligilactobacillus salitolerans]
MVIKILANQAKIESLLFVSGNQGITVSELAQLCGLMKPAVLAQLKKLQQKYLADHTCSFELYQTGEHYKLTTKKAFAPIIKNYFELPTTSTLSAQAMETLAIVAYKQPITRTEIDEIRGVQSSAMLQKLIRYDLLKEAGRSDLPGRPILYVTTEEFLNYFGLTNLSELPQLEEQQKTEPEEDTDHLLGLFEKTISMNEKQKKDENNG